MEHPQRPFLFGHLTFASIDLTTRAAGMEVTVREPTSTHAGERCTAPRVMGHVHTCCPAAFAHGGAEVASPPPAVGL